MDTEQPIDKAGPKPPRTWRPMLLWTAAIVVFWGLCWLVAAGVGRYSNAREHWIVTTKVRLAEIRSKGVTRFEQPVDEKEKGYKGYYLYIGEGAVRVGANGWVYIITHSGHDDEGFPRSMLPRVGDVSVAIDQDGNYYLSNEHPCGCLMMTCSQPDGFKDIAEFLNIPYVIWRPMQ